MEQPKLDSGVSFQRWPEIKNLHNVCTSVVNSRKSYEETGKFYPPMDQAWKSPIAYRAKEKLHGTTLKFPLNTCNNGNARY